MDLTVEFVTQTCCVASCGITWAMTKKFNNERIADHKEWYCPNGHSQYYSGKSDLEKARHELAQTKEELFRIKNCAEHKKRRISSLRGVITKMKKKG